jgi:N-acetylmuramoyl-L-alanine amidase
MSITTKFHHLPLGLGLSVAISYPGMAQELYLAYPNDQHETTAEQIFFIGTADPQAPVYINGTLIDRSGQGHFAPSFPLQVGANTFTIRGDRGEINRTIIRTSTVPTAVNGLTELSPNLDLGRLPGELICFSAIAPPNSRVNVAIANQNLDLVSQPPITNLALGNAALINGASGQDQAITSLYAGCTSFDQPGNLGYPTFTWQGIEGQTQIKGQGQITILDPDRLEVVATNNTGVTRTGPSTTYSRLTPLVPGVRDTVTGTEGDWVRLGYGVWLKREETTTLPGTIPVHSLIRSVTSRNRGDRTDIIFPLEQPVPYSLEQGEGYVTLHLYNVTAQTDLIRLDDDPLIKRLDWHQPEPGHITYRFALKQPQLWGFDLNYSGTNLVLTLRHPPVARQGVTGKTVLIDPGHGGSESGAIGPNGYPEKDANLAISLLLAESLKGMGANVVMSRTTDEEIGLKERMDLIHRTAPDVALSIHHNALPDGGDAIATAGIGTFWYYPQAHDLAVFLQNHLVNTLDRPYYGIFWNNLALTRPHIAPTVLLELGFMINPQEFEWISDGTANQQVATTIAEGVDLWFKSHSP